MVLLAPAAASAQGKTLDIYFIDVEGGQSTLVVTPAGETLLIDTGFPSSGTFASVPGDPAKARDANRIIAAARAAGVTRIDYLLVTHFHADHDGAVPELSQLIPIQTFVDHEAPGPQAEERVPGTAAAFEAYARARAKGKHLAPKPGDGIPLKGIDTVVVSAAGATITKPFDGAGAANPACGASAPAAQEPSENRARPASAFGTGVSRFSTSAISGALRFLRSSARRIIAADGSVSGRASRRPDAADAATFAAIAPRVAILNNGKAKGGSKEVLDALHHAPGLEDAWQLHRSLPPGPRFFNDDRVANLDESTAFWLKVSAKPDGSFVVTNARTGEAKAYGASRPTPRAVK
jgi:hypothetical protein